MGKPNPKPRRVIPRGRGAIALHQKTIIKKIIKKVGGKKFLW